MMRQVLAILLLGACVQIAAGTCEPCVCSPDSSPPPASPSPVTGSIPGVYGGPYGGYYGGYGGYGSYPPPPPTYAVPDPCYNISGLNLTYLQPCDGQLPTQICRGNNEFEEGGFLHQFWFVLENGTTRGFAKTNHGTFYTYPTSFVATSDDGWNITEQQIICRIMDVTDVKLNLKSSPPTITIMETCRFGGATELRFSTHVFAPAEPAHCTPQLVPQAPQRFVAYAEADVNAGVNVNAGASGSGSSSPAITALAALIAVLAFGAMSISG